jgi:2-aminoadipate transaminase
MKIQFAERTGRMRASIIREILKVSSRPGMTSFAGGLPAPEMFPTKQFEIAVRDTLRVDGRKALQYMVTEGHAGLKEFLCRWLEKQEIYSKPEQMLLTHGSQQALDLLGKIFLNPGDSILVEDPTYLGAIQSFNAYQPKYVTVATDEEGMIPADLEKKLSKNKIRFIYTVPTFQNPTGITMSLRRRKALIALARKKNVTIIEDDPYGILRFEGQPLPSLYSLADGKGVVYMSTFSKLLSPGIRLGWLVAEKEIVKQLVFAKQASDLQTNTFIQYAVYHYCKHGFLDKHIPLIIADYKRRASVMMEAIRAYFPADVKCFEPQGGMFVWCQLPGGLKASQVFPKAIQKKVAFVDGSVFYANGGGENTMRLNFTNSTDAAIRSGIERLGKVISSFL